MNRLTWKPPRNRNYDAWERWQRSKLDEATTAPANVPAGSTRAPVFNPERDLPPAPDLTPPPGSRSAENIALAEKARAEWDEIRKANNTEPEWADVYALGYASWQSFAEAELGGFAIDTARGWQGRAASICRALASGPPEAGGAGGGASAKSKAALESPGPPSRSRRCRSHLDRRPQSSLLPDPHSRTDTTRFDGERASSCSTPHGRRVA